jgi:hypothetical protein
MAVRCEYFDSGCASMLTEKRELADVCIAALRNKDRLVTNFSKNWHITCKTAVVSKILDWLVQ